MVVYKRKKKKTVVVYERKEKRKKKRERKKRVVVYERKEKRKKKERERGKKWRYSIFSFCISRGTGLRHLAFLGPLQFSQAVVQSFVMYNPEERERKKRMQDNA